MLRCAYIQKVGGRIMSTETSDANPSFVSMLLNPSRTMSNWYAAIGLLGIFLAILNILGQVHPTYHVSWGGLLTFEATNAAFEPKADGTQVVASDFIFIALCAGLAGLGIRTFLADESGIAGWLKAILVNDTWPALVDPDVGGLSLIHI